MLTFDDRYRLLRETKIRHTLAKRQQQGYMNADDYGTVPLPDGYHFNHIPNAPDGGFYGYDGMATNFCALLDQHPVYVDPLEILCCRWRDMLVNYRRNHRWDETRFPTTHLLHDQQRYNITSGIDNDSHFATDYTIGLSLGFPGLLDKLQHCRANNPGHDDFYNAEEQVLLAILRFIDRHLAEIERLLAAENRPEVRHTLTMMLDANRAVRHHPPQNFIQACQCVAYFNCVSRIYTRDGAGFQLDALLWPYLRKDLDDGSLDHDTAVFIIADLLLIDPHYYQISGVDENDRDLTNPLSYMILEAAHKLNISANLTVRVHDHCDPKFLHTAVDYLFTDRNAWPRFCCDDALANGYMRNLGIDKKTARSRIAVGCNWMAVPGREFPMNDTVKINLAKVFETAWNDLDLDDGPSTAKLLHLFRQHLTQAVKTTAEGINLHLDHIWQVTPELVMNLMFHHALETGQDASVCAELHTVGIDGAGLAVAADSFAAIQQRVELEHRLSWKQLDQLLQSDFAGQDGERNRLLLSHSQRYCQGGDSLGDRWAHLLTDAFVSTVKAQPMPHGRQLIPGWFSWSRTIEYGQCVGATPNGRHAHAPISHGANPNPGFRRDAAVTAQAAGIAAVQPGFGNTAPLQLEFYPTLTRAQGGVERIVDLIRTHFKMGGTLININVLDQERLMKAHENPDSAPDLVVRVTGFTAYFCTLSPEFRQLVIDRFLTGL